MRKKGNKKKFVIVSIVATVAIVTSSIFITGYKADACGFDLFNLFGGGSSFWDKNDSDAASYDSSDSYDDDEYTKDSDYDYSGKDGKYDYDSFDSDYSDYDYSGKDGKSDYDSSDYDYQGYDSADSYSKDYDSSSTDSEVKGEFKKNNLIVNGKDSDSVVFGILGDGYTSSQQSSFNSQAKEVANYIVSSEPFNQMKDKINIYSVNVNSQESGAGDSPSDHHNNYFGSCYNNGGIERLLVANDTSKVHSVANSAIGKCDAIIVIVNDTRYGGSGGDIITTSIDSTIDETVLHEIGHTVGKLNDEYWAGSQYASEAPNMTSKKSSPPWSDLVGKNGIGVYPYEENPSWYRPSNNCKMQYLGKEHPFCEVCKRQLLKEMKSIISRK